MIDADAGEVEHARVKLPGRNDLLGPRMASIRLVNEMPTPVPETLFSSVSSDFVELRMTTYQFEVADELWQEWKRTVHRDKYLDERIGELLEADAHGRVIEPGDLRAPGETELEKPARLPEIDFPRDYRECANAVYGARDHLRENGPSSMREIVREVMPAYPVGYDVPEDLGEVEQFRGAWWHRIVKPGLETLEDIEAPPPGESRWRYIEPPF